MLAAWMSFVFVVTLLSGVSALAAERIALIFRRQSRWIWVAAMVCTIALTLLAQRTRPPSESATLQSLGLARESNELRTIADSPVVWLTEQLSDSPASHGSDTWLLAIWVCSSVVLAAYLAVGSLCLRRRLASAQVVSVGGTAVLMTS